MERPWSSVFGSGPLSPRTMTFMKGPDRKMDISSRRICADTNGSASQDGRRQMVLSLFIIGTDAWTPSVKVRTNHLAHFGGLMKDTCLGFAETLLLWRRCWFNGSKGPYTGVHSEQVWPGHFGWDHLRLRKTIAGVGPLDLQLSSGLMLDGELQ